MEVLPIVTLYSLRMSTRGEVQQIFIPEEENLKRNKLVDTYLIITGSVQIGIFIKDTTYLGEPDVLNGEGCLSLQRRSKCGELYGQRGQSAE